MYIRPVCLTTSKLSIWWPLWQAVLLHRRVPPTVLARIMRRIQAGVHVQHGAEHLLPLLEDDRQVWRRPPLLVEYPPAFQPPPPELDLRWPSDEPLDQAEIVIVERMIHEQPPPSGEFIDILY